MSKWRERYKSARGKSARGGEGGADYDGLPILSEAMAGVPNEKRDGFDVPPASLTLWLADGLVKFALGAQFDTVKTFGTIADLSEGLYGVEKALDEGKCETKNMPRAR